MDFTQRNGLLVVVSVSIPEGFPMVKKDEPQQASPNNPDAALRTDKSQQGGLKDQKDPGKNIPNTHHEHQDRQDRHGSGEGETSMQPGAGHPRGR